MDENNFRYVLFGVYARNNSFEAHLVEIKRPFSDDIVICFHVPPIHDSLSYFGPLFSNLPPPYDDFGRPYWEPNPGEALISKNRFLAFHSSMVEVYLDQKYREV